MRYNDNMMNKRSYKKYTEVYADLVNYCRTELAANNRILPGERELAVQLKTSRMTLRKALEQASLNRIIHQENKHTEILDQKPSLRQCGRILFITAGFYDKPLLGAMNRLYVKLKSEMDSLNADFGLLLINDFTTIDEVKTKCEDANIILIAVFPQINPVICNYLESLDCWKTVIALSDPHLNHYRNFVALDNREAGKIAGKALLEAGCRKLVFIGGNTDNEMFRKRREGFMEILAENGTRGLLFTSSMRMKHFQEVRRQELLQALSSGCDGAFLSSDEGIDYITHDLFERGLVPEQFKLITLHGSGEALCCHPPVTCVNHGTADVAEILIGHLKKMNRNPNVPPVRHLVKPQLYITQTIGNIKSQPLEAL